jgi:NADPH:quinone reductase-like Zn-dependent oxidoreductase
VQINKQGGPEEIKLEEVPVPTLEEGEVLVKVNHAGQSAQAGPATLVQMV